MKTKIENLGSSGSSEPLGWQGGVAQEPPSPCNQYVFDTSHELWTASHWRSEAAGLPGIFSQEPGGQDHFVGDVADYRDPFSVRVSADEIDIVL